MTDATTVAAGDDSTCTLVAGGRLVCWGQGFNCAGPTLLSELGPGWTDLARGASAYCAIDASGNGWEIPSVDTRLESGAICRSYDYDPRATRRGQGVRNIACNDSESCHACAGCAVLGDGTLSCWPSRNARPQRLEPLLAVASEVRRVAQVRVSRGWMCVITDLRRLLCWGDNDFAQLAQGTRAPLRTPTESPTEARAPTEPRWPVPAYQQ